MEFEVRQSSDAAPRPDAGLRLYDMKCNWRTDNIAWPASALDSVNHLQYFAPTRWMPASDAAIARFSAVGYAFGQMLRDSLQVPIGLICNAVGGSTTESWVDRETLETRYPAFLRDWLHNDLIMEWARGRAEKNLSNRPASVEGYGIVPTRHPYEPCYNFEAGILPLDHYPITGIIWYQGESNAERVEVHEELFPLLVDSWRNYFSDVPFYYVQLSSLNRTCWPIFRDSQRRLLGARPGLGMVVTSDLGDPTDVHYRQKRPVGERLALQALEKHYGHAVKADGPLAKEAARAGQDVYVDFYPQDALRSADGGPIVGFEVQDAADGLFHPVAAEVSGGLVRLDCAAIRVPKAVRYAWQPYTRANLVNATGLPASTFRLPVR
jgi:sialate O-acetylesterase